MTTKIGSIISTDITVDNTDNLRDFYKEVVGWEVEEILMEDENGKYTDYVVKNNEGEWVGGICHQRGVNKDLPSQWIIYVTVEDIAKKYKEM